VYTGIWRKDSGEVKKDYMMPSGKGKEEGFMGVTKSSILSAL